MSGRGTVRAWIAWASLVAVAHAADDAPFSFSPPDALGEALVSRALMGTTYAYLPAERSAPLRLTITAMPAREIATRVGNLTDVQCINLFLDELAEAHESFFVAAQMRPLAVGSHAFTQFRWTGRRDGHNLTGILSCRRIGEFYFAIDFVDAVPDAMRSFPAIRAGLREFAASPSP